MKRIPRDVRDLACTYAREVQHRRALGDKQAEYHSQHPKNRAYVMMLDQGFTPKQLVRAFRLIVRTCKVAR